MKWRIVAVTLDDGTTVAVTEERLRRYLETGNENDLVDGHPSRRNAATMQLHTLIRRAMKRADASERASLPRKKSTAALTSEAVEAHRKAWLSQGKPLRGWCKAAAIDFDVSQDTIKRKISA